MKKLPPKPPLYRVMRDGVSVLCENCHSTCSRSGFLGLFGKRYCDNSKCINSKEMEELNNGKREVVGSDEWKAAFDLHIKDTFEDELADVMIRVMDLAAFKGIDLESHIEAKMNRNSLRERKHGKKY